MKRKILQFILKRLKNANYTHFKECYECAVKRGSPQLCEQCYWVRENYKPNRIIFMNQQEERWLRFIEHKPNIRLLPDSEYNDLKSFLQSEINLALANRDKEIVEMIEDMFLCNYPIYDKNRNIKEIEKDIINLITKANKE